MELPDGAPARVDGQQQGAVVNPLSDGGTKDSNAVLSFFPKEHRAIGKAYSNAGGVPSLLYRWVQLVSSVTALVLLLRGDAAEQRGEGALLLVQRHICGSLSLSGPPPLLLL